MAIKNIKKQISEAILKYEKEELGFEEAQNIIKSLTQKEVTQYTLDNYWRSENLEELVDFLAIKEIEKWSTINDIEALKLITEIQQNITSGAIIEKNGNALEKRYSKVKGTVIHLIFQEDITEATEILKRLKINTSLKL